MCLTCLRLPSLPCNVTGLFSLALLFWNQTCTTFLSSPVTATSSAFTSFEGYFSISYDSSNASRCWGLMLVRRCVFICYDIVSRGQTHNTFASCFLDKIFPFDTTCCFELLVCFINILHRLYLWWRSSISCLARIAADVGTLSIILWQKSSISRIHHLLQSLGVYAHMCAISTSGIGSSTYGKGRIHVLFSAANCQNHNFIITDKQYR